MSFSILDYYWLLTISGLVLGSFYLVTPRSNKFPQWRLRDLLGILLPTIFAGFIGGKIIILAARLFGTGSNEYFLELLKYNGFRLHGGILFGLLTIHFSKTLYSRNLHRYYRLLDKLAIYICIAIALGSVGCFIEGHTGCSGIPTNLSWGTKYTHSDNPRLTNCHPVQLYRVVFFITLILFIVIQPIRRVGHLFIQFAWLTVFFLFFVEFLKNRSIIFWYFSIGHIAYLLSSFVILTMTFNHKVFTLNQKKNYL